MEVTSDLVATSKMTIKFFKHSEQKGVVFHHFMVQWSGDVAFEFELQDRYSHMLKFKKALQNRMGPNYKLPSFPNRCPVKLMTSFCAKLRTKKLQKFFNTLQESEDV